MSSILDVLKLYPIARARRRALGAFALVHGIKRRWLGLEPDRLLRRRVLERIRSFERYMRGQPSQEEYGPPPVAIVVKDR